MTVRLTKKDYEYLRTLKSGVQQRMFNERTTKKLDTEEQRRKRALVQAHNDEVSDATAQWLDDLIKK